MKAVQVNDSKNCLHSISFWNLFKLIKYIISPPFLLEDKMSYCLFERRTEKKEIKPDDDHYFPKTGSVGTKIANCLMISVAIYY